VSAQPSILLSRADSVAVCLKELESVGHKAESLVITESYALITILNRPNAKSLHGCYRGILGNGSGRMALYEIKMHDVFVQWRVPYFDAQRSARIS